MLLEDSAEDSWTGSHMVFSFLGLLNRLLFVYMPFNIPQFIVFFSFPIYLFMSFHQFSLSQCLVCLIGSEMGSDLASDLF